MHTLGLVCCIVLLTFRLTSARSTECDGMGFTGDLSCATCGKLIVSVRSAGHIETVKDAEVTSLKTDCLKCCKEERDPVRYTSAWLLFSPYSSDNEHGLTEFLRSDTGLKAFEGQITLRKISGVKPMIFLQHPVSDDQSAENAAKETKGEPGSLPDFSSSEGEQVLIRGWSAADITEFLKSRLLTQH